MIKKGFDVSKYNEIDWRLFSQNYFDFGILKVTEKSNKKEPKFEEHYHGCKNYSIPVGVYKYVYARNVSETIKEAYAIIDALAGKDITCGVWLDMEDKTIANLSKDRLSKIIYTEANIIRNAGYPVGIYCNKYWYDSVLDSKELRKDFPFWIARYPWNDKGDFNGESKLCPNDYAVIWQYSSKGKKTGCKGYLDLNVSFVHLTELMKPIEKNTYFPMFHENSGSIKYALNSLGFDGSLENRRIIAEHNGIKDYCGQSVNNIYMLDLLKKGLLKK